MHETNHVQNRSARQVDDTEWDIVDDAGARVAIIWPTPDGWRSAPIGGTDQHAGITDRSFDVVLNHALHNF